MTVPIASLEVLAASQQQPQQQGDRRDSREPEEAESDWGEEALDIAALAGLEDDSGNKKGGAPGGGRGAAKVRRLNVIEARARAVLRRRLRLCDHLVSFLLRADAQRNYRVAPLQGQAAAAALAGAEAKLLDLSTAVVLTEDGRLLDRSTAICYVLRALGGGWRVLGQALTLVPRPLRDFGYGVVARSRYQVFGERASCRLPSPAELGRFLD